MARDRRIWIALVILVVVLGTVALLPWEGQLTANPCADLVNEIGSPTQLAKFQSREA
jgi:hypothetical protein